MSEILNNCVMEAVLIHSPRHDELAVFYQQAFQWGDPKVYSNDHLGFSLENIYLGFERLADADVSAQGRTSLWFRVKHIESLIERLTDLAPRSPTPCTITRLSRNPTPSFWTQRATLSASSSATERV